MALELLEDIPQYLSWVNRTALQISNNTIPYIKKSNSISRNIRNWRTI
ncbi:hypothetical protein LWM68_01105 [Niabella sp. W65]|nr:hypothetical protein [Niabella sp. W65]MCH7361502.1 hypothetical protein [Niabella sp. W65]